MEMVRTFHGDFFPNSGPSDPDKRRGYLEKKTSMEAYDWENPWN
jgi:hypothetical protein